MINPLLTIAIPTYNRLKELERQLLRVVPQLTDQTELLIIDNCSDLSIEELRSSINAIAGEIPVRIERNNGNIGLAANICRCYEFARGEWVWTLGDDDEIVPNAVGLLLQLISEVASAELTGQPIVNALFCSTGIWKNQSRVICDSADAFWRELRVPKVFSNVLFLSSNVFRRSVALRNLGVGYKNTYSAAPHVAIASVALQQGGVVWMDPIYLTNWQVAAEDQRWNCFAVAAGLPSLMDIPGLDGLVLRNLAPGHELVLWKPFLIGGIKLLLMDETRSSQFWYAVLMRWFPLLIGRKKLFCMALIILAKICQWFPWLRSWIGQRLRNADVIAENIGLGNSRL